MNQPFIIYALPRSRTFWLSRALSYGGWHCGHDELRHVRSLDDVHRWLSQPCTGTVEIEAAPFWRLARDVKTIVIRRPVDEVISSLLRTGLPFEAAKVAAEIRALDRKLDQIEARMRGVLSVSSAALSDEATFARVFEHCLPFRHDPAWFAQMAPVNLQTNMPARLRYFQAHSSQLGQAALTAKHTTLMGFERTPKVPEGIEIGLESVAKLRVEGLDLLIEHALAIGESPDTHLTKNFALAEMLESIGALQVMVARGNGRMLGYLVALLHPSLDDPNLKLAVHTGFFVSKIAPGLGLKLQRASVEALRARGVTQIEFEAGIRGSGPRLGALYRRLGAERTGDRYRIKLEAA